MTQTAVNVAPYGTWSSPISSASAVAQTIAISYVFVDPITQEVYHIERRPAERGRSVIVHSRTSTDLFEQGSSWNARSAVHEYGGGAATAHDGTVYFSNVGDGRLYGFSVVVQGNHRDANVIAETPSPVTPVDDRQRYASPTPHPVQRHLLVAIQEDHTHDTPSTVVNSLVCIDTSTSTVYPLISGADFYAAPSFSPDGTKLAWQAWNHPHMPWVGTSIWVADIVFAAHTSPPMQTANHTRTATSMPPQPNHPGSGVSYVSWLDNNTLLFLAEASGWRNPWIYRLSLQNANPVLKAPIQEDFAPIYGLLGSSYYAPLDFPAREHDTPKGPRGSMREMLFVAYRGGRSILYIVDLARRGRAEAIELECPFVDVGCVRSVGHSTGKDSAQVVFIASSADVPSTVTFCTVSRLHNGYSASFSSTQTTPVEDLAAWISFPRPITLTDGKSEPLHVTYYAPSNPTFVAPDGEQPPCIVNVHGGPTAAALQSLDWTKQWYTSRGWAWLDVNYRGSSLYGRRYTNRLNGQWGVPDVLDCIHAARALSSLPYSLVDPVRCVIRGASAGGYTVLGYAAGTYCTDDAQPGLSRTRANTGFAFRAGASHYGIGDLAALAPGPSKFESHRVFELLGGRPDEPGMADVYRQRSPAFHANNVTMPLLLLQGLADRVVPPEQSQGMMDAIVAQGGSERVKYKTYEGEGHGFSRADSKRSALEEEATWFAWWLGIEVRL